METFEPQTKPQEKNIISIAIFVLGAFLVFLGFYFLPALFMERTPQTKEEDRSRVVYEKGRVLFLEGSALSIPEFEQAFRLSTSPIGKAWAEFNLGNAELLFGDTFKGIDILRSVSTNEAYPSLPRSGSVFALMDYYVRNSTTELSKAIFIGDWARFRLVGAYNPKEEVENVYVWAHDSIIHYYPIAFWLADRYASRAIGAQYANDQQTEDTYANLAQLRLDEGDVVLSKQSSEDSPVFIAGGLRYRTEAIGILYILGKISDINLFHESYENAFDATVAIPDVFTRMALQQQLNLSYALLLVHPSIISQTGVDKKIHNALTPIVNSTILDGTLAKDNRLSPMVQAALVKLARMSTPLKNKLLSLGWGDSDFD